jgi:uncharacterized membrane protein YjjP (DUF1212 family)
VTSTADPRISFILRLGRSLHATGYSAPRLEEALKLASGKLGFEGQFFSTPTSIMASFGPQDDQRTFMIRVEPGDPDLGKLALVDEVARDVLAGQRQPLDGLARLEQIEAAAPRYRPWLTTLAFGVVSASAARFLGGGWREMLAALLIGIVTGSLAIIATRAPAIGRVFEIVAAIVASMLATLLAAMGFPVSVFLATLAGVIVLIPGLTLTTAINELATRHLASGTARLMGALVLLLGIAFGIALGSRLVTLVTGPLLGGDALPLPEWTLLPVLLLAPVFFAILLKAEPRDIIWIVLGSVLAFGGARLGSEALGAELGAFGGAFVAGVAGNWFARATSRPPQVLLVPGLLLLVPGSVGLRSLTSLLDRNTMVGIDDAFRMLIIAVALAAGLLVANVVSERPRLRDALVP